MVFRWVVVGLRVVARGVVVRRVVVVVVVRLVVAALVVVRGGGAGGVGRKSTFSTDILNLPGCGVDTWDKKRVAIVTN